jgi:hypothetical protein
MWLCVLVWVLKAASWMYLVVLALLQTEVLLCFAQVVRPLSTAEVDP